MSNTPRQLPEGFVQHTDFVSAQIGPYRGFLPDIEPVAEKLAQQGIRVLLHRLFGEFSSSNSRLQTNPNLIYLFIRGQFLENAMWTDILQVVADAMNEYRQQYNQKLSEMFRVERLKIHHSAITVTSSKIKSEPISLMLTDGNYFRLVYYAHGRDYFGNTPWHGYSKRWSRDKKVMFGENNDHKNGKTHFEIKVSADVKPPLTMLTPKNVLEEKVLMPLVFFREPTVP